MQEPSHPLTGVRRMAKVTALVPGAPPKVTVQLGGDDGTSVTAGDPQDLPYLDSYQPTVGDKVATSSVGGDHLVLGSVASGGGTSFQGTALKGTYDPLKPIRHVYATWSGTADSNGFASLALPDNPVVSILSAQVSPVLGTTATDVYTVVRLDVSQLGPSPVASLVFQHRLLSTGAGVASRAYHHSAHITYQI